ncbi:MAG: hypothetical protein ACUVXI_07965 [bacterium]
MLTSTFYTDEINYIGQTLDRDFDVYSRSGFAYAQGVSMPQGEAARIIVDHFTKIHRLEDLIAAVIKLDGNYLKGRAISLRGTDGLSRFLRQHGYFYNPDTGRLERRRANGQIDSWAFVHEGNEYSFGFLSVDISGNSKIVSRYPREDVERVYRSLYKYLCEKVERRHGRFWSWQGDGGLCAFYCDDISNAAVNSAVDILLGMPLFNTESNSLNDDIRLRLAVHRGKAIYIAQKGNIISEDINFVSHLEKNGTDVNSISISDRIFRELSPRMGRYFSKAGLFEGQQIYKFSFSTTSLPEG